MRSGTRSRKNKSNAKRNGRACALPSGINSRKKSLAGRARASRRRRTWRDRAGDRAGTSRSRIDRDRRAAAATVGEHVSTAGEEENRAYDEQRADDHTENAETTA